MKCRWCGGKITQLDAYISWGNVGKSGTVTAQRCDKLQGFGCEKCGVFTVEESGFKKIVMKGEPEE